MFACALKPQCGRSFQIFLMALPGGVSSFQTLKSQYYKKQRRKKLCRRSCETHQKRHRSGRRYPSPCFHFSTALAVVLPFSDFLTGDIN